MLSGQWGGNCRLWSHGKLVRELPGGRATAIAFHPDRKHYLIFADGNLYQGILVPDLTKSLPADSSPEGAQGPRVTILQPAEPVSFEVPENLCLINAWALAVRPDGKRVVTGHEDGLLVEWDLQTRKIVSYYKSKLGEILDVAYMSNGLTTSKGVKFTGARDEKTPYYWAPGEKKHTLRMPRWLQPVLLETPVVEQPKAE